MKYKNKYLTSSQIKKKIIFGSLFILLSLFILIVFLTYHENDPSYNNITTVKVSRNFFGTFGGYVADLLVQFLSFSTIVFAYVFIVFGLNIIFNKNSICNNIAKFFAFIGLFISTSILLTNIHYSKCYLTCGGLLGDLVKRSFYNIPIYSINLLSILIFFISISFFLDITHRWWIIKTTRLYLFFKKVFTVFCVYFTFCLKKILSKNIFHKIERVFYKIYTFFSKTNDIFSTNDMNHYTSNYNIPNNINIISNNVNENTNIDSKKIDLFSFLNKNSFETEIKKHDIKLNNLNKSCPNIQYFSKELDINNDILYKLPDLSLLNDNLQNKKIEISQSELEKQSNQLIAVLKEYGVMAKRVSEKYGPIVTLYEFELAPGTKESRVIGLSNDIARSIKVSPVRIFSTPSRGTICIELPNKNREIIYIKNLLQSGEFQNNKCDIPIVIGSNISGYPVISDLAKMPHLLVAGTTGSGKSVGINSIIVSLLYKFSPNECKFILIDPKILEFSIYNDIPHLLTPVVVDPTEAISALKWVCREMDDRFKRMSLLKMGIKNIRDYNRVVDMFISQNIKEQVNYDSIDYDLEYKGVKVYKEKMPYIVVIIDEVADLMMTAGKEVDACIQRISQKARAAGIHLIIATQRPSVDVITGIIKSNFPARMSFQVASKIDSKIIIGEQGAEQLLGKGDMLFAEVYGRVNRVHGPYIFPEELERILNFIKSQNIKPNYVQDIFLKDEDEYNIDDDNNDIESYSMDNNKNDLLYKQALNIVLKERKCSISYIQRRLRIGYNKSANIVEQLENNGILSSPNSQGKREILIKKNDNTNLVESDEEE